MLPQMPMQGRMGPGMMPSGLGGGNRMMGMNQIPRYPMMNPMMGQPQQMNRGGGFLSRMFGRGNPGGGLNPFMGMPSAGRAAGGSGSFLQSLTNPGRISSFLNNTQQVIKTAQSVGPMIQQYGPIIRNLPAIWKLYRGLKDAPDSSEEKEKTAGDTKTTNPKKTKAAAKSNNEPAAISNQEKASNQRSGKKRMGATPKKGASIPKLYI